MNELSSLGLILLFALMAGHLVKFLRLPEVTGYILAGVMVGPSVLGWVSHENLSALSIFSEVALGLILFSIGSVFEYTKLRSTGAGVLRVTVVESLMAALLVCGTMLVFHQSWQASLLLGAVAMATAPASTLMVIRECNATGPLSDTLTGIIGLNNIFCLTAFLLVAAILDLSGSLPGSESVLLTIYESIYPLFWQLLGSVALGFLVGLLLASWATKVTEHGEMIILLTGCVLLCVGLALVFELSTLVASLAVGATMVNLSASSRKLFYALSRSDPPFYAIFFVIAGADLNLALLGSLGLLGMIYVAARGIGKFAGAKYGARRAGLPATVQRLLGFGLMSQAGLAIGLTLVINRRYPEFGPAVATVVLAAVVVNEIIGPISTRVAINRSGESQPRDLEPLGAFD
jgi:Kef-type K+ transport system membrane component KefB